LPDKLHKLKDFFGYSRTERNGILILFILLILTILTNILLPFFIKTGSTDFSEFESKIIAFEQQQKEIKDSLKRIKPIKNKYDEDRSIQLNPFYFDPNNLPVNEWQKLGLNDWQVEVIKNYERKGGKFYKPEDLAKIYSISEKEYQILEPYIIIESKSDKEEKKVLRPFPFDPNVAVKEELGKMGMRENLADAIINYREKGGRFFQKEDVKKIYIITDEEFLALEPYIFIEKDTLETVHPSHVFIDTFQIEINSADTLDLQQLRGIGPAFAGRIVKYRELLGGYVSKQQLLEVYGMETTRYEGIKNHIHVDISHVNKININKTTIKEMIRHPYIEFYVAKSIITHRKEIGVYTKLEEIKNARLIYDELFNKLKPYLTLN
jgi:DNA uptake protein ComE-like DNA-binding protein